MRWFLQHLPHIIPLALGFAVLAKLAFAVLDQPPPEAGDEQLRAWHEARDRQRQVRRRVARAGLLALVPLLLSLASGLVIYSVNLGGSRPGGGLVWAHVGVSLMALALVAWKLRAVGGRALREGLDPHEAVRAGSSLLTGLLLAPLLLTGVVLLIEPSGSSFWAYFHLVAGAWWAVLFNWHLWRHFPPALQAVVEPEQQAAKSIV